MSLPLAFALIVLSALAGWGFRSLWEDLKRIRDDAADLRSKIGPMGLELGQTTLRVIDLERNGPKRQGNHVIDAADDILANQAIDDDEDLRLALYIREMNKILDAKQEIRNERVAIAQAIRAGNYDPRKSIGKREGTK